MISVKVDAEANRRLLSTLSSIEGGANKALYRTIKKTQSKAKTAASQMIRKDLNLSAKYVGGKIFKSRIDIGQLTGRIYMSKRGILLSRFPYRENRGGGFAVKVKRNGQYKVMQNAFEISLKGSNLIGLAIRGNKREFGSWLNASAGQEHDYVNVMHGPSPSQVMSDKIPKLREQMAIYSRDQLEKEVATMLRRGR